MSSNCVRVQVRFFVGQDPSAEMQRRVEAEAKRYGDVVIVPYPESYRAVVNKTKWIVEYGATEARARFIMKSDDDSFIHVEGILRLLEKTVSASYSKELYIGYFSNFATPHRKRTHQWYVSPTVWERNVFPPFAHGVHHTCAIANLLV